MALDTIRRFLRKGEHWLFALAYTPSLLFLVASAPGLPRLVRGDATLVWLVAYAVLGALAPFARLIASLTMRNNPQTPMTTCAAWAPRIALLLNWVPHHLAVIAVGLATAIGPGGWID